MPRRLRIEFEGAIYHVMACGNARQDIVHDDDDRRRLLDDLERTVVRSGWELPAFVVLSNHLHLLVKTPCEPRRGNATVPVVVCALVASPLGPAGAPVPGTLPRGD